MIGTSSMEKKDKGNTWMLDFAIGHVLFYMHFGITDDKPDVLISPTDRLAHLFCHLGIMWRNTRDE